MTVNLVIEMETMGDKNESKSRIAMKGLKKQCFDCKFLEILELLKITRDLYTL